VTWPGSFVWSGGQPPALQQAGTDVIVGWSPDNGTTWYTAGIMLAATGTKPVTTLTPVTGSTTSQAEASLATVVVPAGKLASAGDRVRITMHVDTVSGGGNPWTARVKFGATYVATLSGVGGNDGGVITVDVARTGATAQYGFAVKVRTGGTLTTERTVPGETLSGPVTVDFRGLVNNTPSDTLFLRAGSVEAITA